MTNSTIANNITVLNDTQNDVRVIYYNSKNDDSLSSMLTNGMSFASIRESYKNGGKEESILNQTVWYNDNTKYYIAVLGNDNTHDNILIITKNKEILTHMISTVTYLNINNSSNNSTNDSTVKDDSSLDSNSSDNGPSVVSKKRYYNAQEGHGYFDEVRYSDGNFRQYDSESGKLIGSSYDSDQEANGGSLPGRT
ncbi:hypothetical protein BGI41_04320 [Methanobrevibacter sp. 87.7]|nr:hypothetical protein BGI41_04320 [Methanobrevibacter sp. 87.7]